MSPASSLLFHLGSSYSPSQSQLTLTYSAVFGRLAERLHPVYWLARKLAQPAPLPVALRKVCSEGTTVILFWVNLDLNSQPFVGAPVKAKEVGRGKD